MPDPTPRGTRSGRVQIGAVVAQLKDEFPDVSISKIRFLESEGLVRPTRSASGYRYFSAEDVDRIRFVLRAQRERFWPLKVIAETLDAMDRGLVTDEAGSPARARVPTPEPADPVPGPDELRPVGEGLRLTRPELAGAAGLEVAAVDALVEFGLLTVGRDGYLGADAVQVAQAAAPLFARGLEARHLRPFRLAAEREVALVEQASRVERSGEARAAAAEVVAHECLALHAALVRAALAAARG